MLTRRISVLLLGLALASAPACTQNLDFGKFSPGGTQADGWFPDSTPLDLGPPREFSAPDASKITGCKPKSFSLKQAPPSEIYLVVDKSGSMAEKGAGASVSKWSEMQSAVSEVLKQFQGTVRLGLLMYPVDHQCKTSGPQVVIGLSKINAILYNLGLAKPSGGTPTGSALNNAAQSLKDLGSSDSRKYLLLVTDGGPNCNFALSSACTCTHASKDYCCTSYPGACASGHTCLDETRTLKIIKDLHTKDKISTFVIGLDGTAEYKTLLSEMAKAGGVPLSVSGATVSYYSAGDLVGLKSALKTIVGSVISCEIKLDEQPKEPDSVYIWLDGKKIERDKTKSNGWDYTDGTYLKIKLYGKACESLQVGKDHKLTATFKCEQT